MGEGGSLKKIWRSEEGCPPYAKGARVFGIDDAGNVVFYTARVEGRDRAREDFAIVPDNFPVKAFEDARATTVGDLRGRWKNLREQGKGRVVFEPDYPRIAKRAVQAFLSGRELEFRGDAHELEEDAVGDGTVTVVVTASIKLVRVGADGPEGGNASFVVTIDRGGFPRVLRAYQVGTSILSPGTWAWDGHNWAEIKSVMA